MRPIQVTSDKLLLIRIEGMHCHKCEGRIQKNLAGTTGVHEVEVDFPSGQASVLFDPMAVSAETLLKVVTDTGYEVKGMSFIEPGQG